MFLGEEELVEIGELIVLGLHQEIFSFQVVVDGG
jgi:hypothetical protein